MRAQFPYPKSITVSLFSYAFISSGSCLVCAFAGTLVLPQRGKTSLGSAASLSPRLRRGEPCPLLASTPRSITAKPPAKDNEPGGVRANGDFSQSSLSRRGNPNAEAFGRRGCLSPSWAGSPTGEFRSRRDCERPLASSASGGGKIDLSEKTDRVIRALDMPGYNTKGCVNFYRQNI